MNNEKEKILSDIYFDNGHPGSYGGESRLHQYAKKYGISLNEVKKFLQKELSYTLHKPVIKKFKRNKIYTYGKNYQLQADLVDVSNISDDNDGHKFILTIIDVFSKKAFAYPLKNKEADSIVEAFKHYLKNNVPPVYLQVDRGKEFVNKKFKKLLDDNFIQIFYSNNEKKCAIVERLNRTLKTRMYRFFTANSTNFWLPYLQKFINSINNSYHRSIGMRPNDVNYKNEKYVFKKLYGVNNFIELNKRRKTSLENKNKILPFGQKVRVAKGTIAFRKGYLPQWSDKVYILKKKRNDFHSPMYSLTDENNKKVDRNFYFKEIQPVTITSDTKYRIEKILDQKIENGIKKYYIKWLGFDNSYNSWIDENDF